MVKTISSSAQTQANLDSPWYTEIYTVTITGQPTLRFTPTPVTATGNAVAFSFAGQDYQSFQISRSKVQTNATNEISGCSVRFQNVDQAIGAIILNNDITGGEVSVSGIFLSSGTNQPISNSNLDLVPVFRGTIGATSFDSKFVEIQLDRPLKDIRSRIPRRYYSSPLFNFQNVV